MLQTYNPSLISLFLFALFWAALIYAINCLIAGKVKKVDLRQAILYYIGMAMIGLLGEIFVGSFYHLTTGHILWQYTVYPIHHGYTSKFAMFLWGIYGLHLCMLHDTLKSKGISSIHRLAGLFCLEAVAIEAALNLTYRFCFGHFIYYYFPTDLWHLTSLQTLPFYLIGGYVIIKAFRRFETSPQLFGCLSLGITGFLVLVTK